MVAALVLVLVLVRVLVLVSFVVVVAASSCAVIAVAWNDSIENKHTTLTSGNDQLLLSSSRFFSVYVVLGRSPLCDPS